VSVCVCVLIAIIIIRLAEEEDVGSRSRSSSFRAHSLGVHFIVQTDSPHPTRAYTYPYYIVI